MSRVAKNPVVLPKGVEVSITGGVLKAKGSKGQLEQPIHPMVDVIQEDNQLVFKPKQASKQGWALSGTMRALANNVVVGVSEGFEKKLQLVGVGYRAQAKGNVINLTLGFSHPVDYELPSGITAETPSQTDIVLRGSDKQLIGQVAAEIRGYRPPEPYKGKGIRYADEHIVRKEAKKK